jgi:hypothetical protein
MKSTLLSAVVALGLASTAQAGGINLAWNDCGAFGAPSRTFACDTNNGVNSLFVSFSPPSSLPDMIGAQGVIDLSSSSGTMPQWWNLPIPGGCRTVLGFQSDFTAGPFNCADPWSGLGATADQYTFQFQGNLNHSRLLWVVTAPTGIPVTAGVEYYAISFNITNQRTVGTPSCAGCLDPVCIVAQQVELLRQAPPSQPSVLITNPLLSQSVTWQTGVANCPGATPSRNSTWGSVKALYR